MNIYLRFFDKEVLVRNAEEALVFLSSIPEIEMTPELENDIINYIESNIAFPKRYKVRQHLYFILIKTEAQTMQEFKEKKNVKAVESKKTPTTESVLETECPGWYKGILTFKRVSIVPGTQKCQYTDTTYIVHCKANSGAHCYERMVESLKRRVDPRSQFPAPRGKYFSFMYLGEAK